MHDPFEPRNEPAKSLYLAFQAEAKKRKVRSVDGKFRTVEEWVAAERDAVFRECLMQAEKLNLQAPTIEQVASCERYAMGPVD